MRFQEKWLRRCVIPRLFEELSQLLETDCQRCRIVDEGALGQLQRAFGKPNRLRQSIAYLQGVELVIENIPKFLFALHYQPSLSWVTRCSASSPAANGS